MQADCFMDDNSSFPIPYASIFNDQEQVIVDLIQFQSHNSDSDHNMGDPVIPPSQLPASLQLWEHPHAISECAPHAGCEQVRLHSTNRALLAAPEGPGGGRARAARGAVGAAAHLRDDQGRGRDRGPVRVCVLLPRRRRAQLRGLRYRDAGPGKQKSC